MISALSTSFALFALSTTLGLLLALLRSNAIQEEIWKQAVAASGAELRDSMH